MSILSTIKHHHFLTLNNFDNPGRQKDLSTLLDYYTF